jgi:glycosyltransferase involved in cell wall biosynthesis
MKIIAQTLVKNEERYLWFAVKSVIDYVDKVLIWDTGSTDRTVEIIKKLQSKYPNKIEFRETGPVGRDGLSTLRQEMLLKSHCDWIILLDGDEVWWQDSIKKVTTSILVNGTKLDSIVTPYVSLIGDIYHRQEEKAGRYKIDGRVGHITIRAINRKIPGLHVEKPYGKEGYFDGEGKPIQERPEGRREFIGAPYLHFSHLERGGNGKSVVDRVKKLKHELGNPLPSDYFYPEVLFQACPKIIQSPWRKMDKRYFFKAALLTPLKKIKRRLFR